MSMYSYEIFDEGGDKVWLQDIGIDQDKAQTIIHNSIEVGRILGASGKLSYAVLGAFEDSENPDEVVEAIMDGLIMGESVERSIRFGRVREALGRITGRQPFFYVRTRG